VLDRWRSHGYIATVGELDGFYVLKKVIYNTAQVPMEKVYEIAHGIDEGTFQCPTCQRKTMERLQAASEAIAVKDADGLKAKQEEQIPAEIVIDEQVPAIKEKEIVKIATKTKKPAVKVIEEEDDYEPIDEDDAREHDRERAVKRILGKMDNMLLFKSFTSNR